MIEKFKNEKNKSLMSFTSGMYINEPESTNFEIYVNSKYNIGKLFQNVIS